MLFQAFLDYVLNKHLAITDMIGEVQGYIGRIYKKLPVYSVEKLETLI